MTKQNKKILFVVIFGLLLVFLFINAHFSQTLPSLFYRLAGQRDKQAAVSFLKRIKEEKDFEKQFSYFKKLYSEEIEAQVYQDEEKRKRAIENLEQVLLLNPKSRDILIKLSLLYFEGGNLGKAADYYQRAKDVDPWLEVEELEEISNIQLNSR